MTFVLCGQIFLAMEIAFCYCFLKDIIQNKEFYNQCEEQKEEK